MRNFKKTVSFVLVGTMLAALVACGKKNDENGSQQVEKSKLYQENTRDIYVGTWYDVWYTSAHQKIEDNPNVADVETATMNLNNMRKIEQKYNIRLYYDNLTWNGVIESINTSIMAGKPEEDVYMCDLQFGIPAVVNHYGYSLEDILTPGDSASEADKTNAALVDEKYLDVFSDAGSDVVSTLKFTNDGTYLFGAKAVNLSAYCLGYNKRLINAAGQDDPYELKMNGQWTWDKWMEEMRALTQDTDNDNVTDQWGFRGAWTVLLTELLMSNNTHIAGTVADPTTGKVTEQLTSEATTEVLNFLADMYQTYKVSFWDADCDSNWDDNVYAWANGNIGFWIAACWISQSADPDQKMYEDQGMVTWPVGPHGNADTNPGFNQTTGTYYMIPAGIENPQLIYCVMYDYFNWYDNDLTLRDDEEWWLEWAYSEQNLDVLRSMADTDQDLTMELWDQVKFDEEYQIRGIIETGAGTEPITVAGFQQANKQLVQDYLDTIFNS